MEDNKKAGRWGRSVAPSTNQNDELVLVGSPMRMSIHYNQLPSKQAHTSNKGTKLTRKSMREHMKKVRRSKVHPHVSHGQARTLTNLSANDVELKDYTHLDSEDSDDEGTQLKKLKLIKDMPASITIKRKLRENLLTEPVRMLKGCSGWRYRQKLQWNKTKIACTEIGNSLEVWRSSFVTIEGHFGSGVVSYFVFLKWLFFLNVYITLLNGIFIVLPQILFPAVDFNSTVLADNTTAAQNLSLMCSAQYTVNVSSDPLQLILDFFSGTGFLEQTLLFYGYYANSEVFIGTFEGIAYNYNMPLAYILVTGTYIFLSLFLMARQITQDIRHSTAAGFRETLVSAEDKFYQYCNKVFGGWDFTLNDVKNAELKHKSLFFELANDLEEDREQARRANRTGGQKCKVYTVRFFINLLVVAILGGSGYLIYYMSQLTLSLTQSVEFTTWSKLIQWAVEYLPSITITVLNAVVPFLFIKLVRGEDYTPDAEVKLTLIRTVFLRMASVAVLVATLYIQIDCSIKDACNVGTDTCTSFTCWETYVGQQIYKLILMDFIVGVGKVFLVEFPRMLIVTKCSCALSRLIGQQEFVIPQNVLDIVYSQTLCWIGAFFSPITPAVSMIKFFLFFYVKKLSLIYTHVPSKRPYRASKSNSFFMIVLLVSFGMCCFPIGWVIARMTPSRGCGPFRVYSLCYEIVAITVAQWPDWMQSIIDFIGSAGFVAPCIIMLILVIYYYTAIVSAHKDMVSLLKEQLVLEGRDKQFLLVRLNTLTAANKPAQYLPPKKEDTNANYGAETGDEVRRRRRNSQFSNIDETRNIQTPPNVPFERIPKW